MKKLLTVLVLVALCLTNVLAQLELNSEGVLCLKKRPDNGSSDFRLGSYVHPEHPGYDNGEWGIEALGDGNLNIWKPWPSPFAGDRNCYFFITSTGNVGIGKSNPAYKLDVNGDIATYGTLRIASDARLKSNISTLASSETIDNLYLLNAKTYVKTLPEIKSSDSLKLAKGIPLDEVGVQPQNASSFEYGFIAQELKEVFPELVTQDKEGYYSINYIGLIPLMVEALKEQNEQNEAQQAEIDSLKRAVLTLTKESNLPHVRSAASPDDGNTALQTPIVGGCRLEQNTPNPFNQLTQIKYYLPETIISAYLCIYDMQGKQLQQIALTQRGEGAELISASQLAPGMYLYALIADGQEVDVKRMILTE